MLRNSFVLNRRPPPWSRDHPKIGFAIFSLEFKTSVPNISMVMSLHLVFVAIGWRPITCGLWTTQS